MSGLSTDQERQIRELIARKQKIAAIKLFRDVTGSSLKDSKEAVEAMEMGAETKFSAPTQGSEPDPSLEDQLKRLLAERKKIEAVKVYRETYNCGLREAKEAVDAIEMQMKRGNFSSMPSASANSNDPFAEESQRNRRFLSFLIAIVLLVIGGVAFFLFAGSGF